ncbi:AMP-binding protein [Streptomyces sp. NPDC001980]|uniref:AMP-binding protein n=1 Tax=Streptomyces sp. NPDC001980 TaxID=3157126 RepID=UPI00331D2543
MAGANELHGLFEAWVRETPDRPAVITERARLTYGELGVRANRLARYLLQRGLGPGETVVVCTDRVPDLLVALLGVLKAGGAYAVVGPHQPTGDIGQLLEEAGANTVLTHERFRPSVDDGAGRIVVCLDTDADVIDACSPEPPAAPCGATAAVLFSAGTTTGRHRPVPAGHARLRAVYGSWAEVFGLGPSDVHLVTAPADTAAFTYGWIRALCSGGTLVLPEGETGPALWGRPFTEGVTVLDTDPVTARSLLDGSVPVGLRLVAVGGERLALDEHVRLRGRPAPGARLLNVYGPVEVTGCGTWFETDQLSGPVADPGLVSLLGRPFPGCRAEVRKGEIWLTPPGGPDDNGAFPTGDAGTLWEDGLLEFGGRLAHRVRVRGRTVDPHRAEAALATHPRIRESVITAVDEDRLVAYVVPTAPRASPDADAIRMHLTGVVPDQEIPAQVVTLGALPRNRAGKVDRRLLPLPAQRAASGGVNGKAGGATAPGPEGFLYGMGCVMLVVALPLAVFLTDVFWPGSTDLTYVPAPWSWLFRGLYAAELLAFSVGLAFLVAGRPLMRRQGRSRGLTTAAHLAIVWLLVSWWPQDNFYRLAAKTDWERQAALVYVFNVPLMIAAVVVAVYVTRRPGTAATE